MSRSPTVGGGERRQMHVEIVNSDEPIIKQVGAACAVRDGRTIVVLDVDLPDEEKSRLIRELASP